MEDKVTNQEGNKTIAAGKNYFEELKDKNPAVGLVIVRNDERDTIVHAEKNFIHYLGYRTAEFNGRFQTLLDLCYPPDHEFFRDSLKSQLNTSDYFEVRVRIQNKAGRLVWLLSKGILIKGEDGREYLAHGFIEDSAKRVTFTTQPDFGWGVNSKTFSEGEL